ncbi:MULTISPECIES: hypothetical protein [unclassified Rhizobium]|uniref:hypothetical protein n=1 Tax=unclassified Rhizobium TaxID=2613769 RepID=UPI0007E9B7C8|nr:MULTISPECIES: hypothetical protein [unclassified Rhizobium]ANM12458.1 hypothetical protein AMK05_CH04131 [Rhizobium sp. N324]ANM18861.1 hypothetical protein AMK06_CH04018 [Rhizobium sp. N541]ANM25246.1 hypothetical protein AMK07_CH04014 [Rhizobium sp. N941]OYD01633.1 hypothetical protein AMK08_CH200035 [Rhizobium sp. N4311]
MGLVAEILRRRDDRYRLAQLRFDLEDAENEFRSKVQEQKLGRGTDAWDRAYFDYDTRREFVYAQIDEIETRNAIERARAWRVPIPQRPISEEPVYDDQYWSWSNPHGRYYLTDEGKLLLRREANIEMEMLFKPWLSWGALAISVISLTISALKL